MDPIIFCLGCVGCVLIGIVVSLAAFTNSRRKRSQRERAQLRGAARREEARRHGYWHVDTQDI